MSKLKEYCINITDGEHGSVKEDLSEEYYFLNNNNITSNGIIIKPDDRRISITEFDRIHKRTKLAAGDIVIATCGTIGKCQVIRDEKINFDFSRSVGIIKCDSSRLLPDFLYYYLINPHTQSRIKKISEGGVQKHFYIGAMQEFDIEVPPIDIQRKIIAVLSAIDKKIQYNNKINDNLQHQLKLLYDYWFTQFDFPDKNGKPYRASGGAMVWCDALHQNIPVNWNISSLGEICSFKNGINYEKDEIGNKQYKIVNVRNITASQMLLDPNSFDTITLSDKKADKYLIEANDFLIARSGSPGATRLLIPSTIPTIYCGFIICCSTSCELKNYIALTLKKLEIANDTKSSGSILKNVSQDTLKEIMLCIPQSKVLDSFNSKANSIIKAMQVTIEENNTLTALRDWLLPMLMNGQATISD